MLNIGRMEEFKEKDNAYVKIKILDLDRACGFWRSRAGSTMADFKAMHSIAEAEPKPSYTHNINTENIYIFFKSELYIRI